MVVIHQAPDEKTAWPWPTYTFRSLPNLSLSRKSTTRIDQIHAIHPIQTIEFLADTSLKWQDILSAVFVQLICLYVDTSDFVFAELRKEAPTSCFRASLSPELSWSDLALVIRRVERYTINPSAARESLGISGTQNPFPAGIAWDTEFANGDAVGGILVQVGPLVGGKVVVDIHWDHAILSPSVVQIFSKQLLSLFDVALNDPSKSSSDPLLFDDSLLSILEAKFNPDEAHCVTDWLSINSKLRPHSIAHEIYNHLGSSPQLVTYREFNAEANRLARWLLDNGLQFEDRVAVCRSRDLQFYVAHAAVFKAGACYVSIDPELPDERKRHIVEDSGARFVLTNLSYFDTFTGPVYTMDSQDFLDQLALKDPSDISLARLDSLAYLLYTSGTTGTPKGCLLSHHGLYWAIQAMCDYPRDVTNAETDKRLALASIAFDVHISEICQVWCLGIRLVSAPRFELLSNLQDNIIQLGITHLGMVPSMIEATLSSPEDLPLKYMVSGGEKISDFVLEHWASNPKLILANFYGPTEATIGCTSRRVSPDDRKHNIGRPFASCSAYVVDSGMKILPLGIAGELIIEGPLVARGYHNLPTETAASFLEWPRTGCRAYRTGDLVRMTPEGTLLILGRIDSQIKLRGVRIESDGISEVIRKATKEKIAAHTLIATHPDLGSDILVSFFARDDPLSTVEKKRKSTPTIMQDASASLAVIRQFVNKELAAYMRPAHIVPVDFLPLTLNGKIDGKKLTSVFTEVSLQELVLLQSKDESNNKDRELTPLEFIVIALTSKFCGIAETELNQTTNLFECGFDSLKFNALTRTLRDQCSASSLSVSDIMEAPIVREIARLCQVRATSSNGGIDETWMEEFDRRYRPVVEALFIPEDVESILPSLPIQDGILAQSMHSKESYVQHFIYCLKDHVDLERLKEAWSKAVIRHDILRAVFVIDSDTLQVVLSPNGAGLPFFIQEAKPITGFVEWFSLEESPRIAIDINEDITSPLFRLNIYRLDTLVYLAVSMHHVLYDGVAFPLLMGEVDALYNGAVLPDPIRLGVIVKQIKSSERQEQSRNFWISQFQGIDLHRRQVRLPNGRQVARLTKTFDAPLRDIRARCGAIHITVEALFASTFAYQGRILFGWSEDAIFGIIRSGRMSPTANFDKAICPLVSVVPLIIRLQQKDSRKLLQSCQSNIARLIPHEHTPLGAIQRWLGVSGLIDVVFSCREKTETNNYKCFEYVPLPPPAPEFSFALEVVLDSFRDKVELRAAFALDEYLIREVEVLLDTFESTLISLLDSSGLTAVPSGSTNSPDVSLEFSELSPHAGQVNPEILLSVRSELSSFLLVDLDHVQENTSLLSLGLDSLKAVALSRRLGELGVPIQPVDIIRATSVQQLVLSASVVVQPKLESDELSQLEQTLSENLDLKALRLGEEDKVHVTVSTALQAGMLSQTIASSGQLYIHAFTFRLLPSCAMEILKEAWMRAIVKLDILRTSFHFLPALGKWAQVIHSSAQMSWSHEKRAVLSDATKHFISSLQFDQEDSFDRPPVYFRHVSCDADYLIVVLHHALYDGISLPKLFNFVRQLYHDHQYGTSITQFWTIAREIVASEGPATKYWAARLQDIEPSVFPRRNIPSVDAWRSSRRIELSLASIRRFCRRYQVGPQAVAQSAWAKVLATLLQRPDVVFGRVVSGRTLQDSENVIGPIFNTIPCRIALKKHQNWKDLVRSVHRSNLDCIPWQHASLRFIHMALGLNALVDTLFLFQPEDGERNIENNLWSSVSRLDEVQTKSQYAINVEVHQGDDSWNVYSSCTADVMDLRRLNSILEEFNLALVNLVSAPEGNVLPPEFPTEGSTHLVDKSRNLTAYDLKRANEVEWDQKNSIVRDILSKFAKVPDDIILQSTSLASFGIDSISALQISGLARRQGVLFTAADVIQSTTVGDLLRTLTHDVVSSSSSPPDVEIKSPSADIILTTIPRCFRRLVESIYPVTPGMEWILGAWQRSGGRRFQHAFVRRFKGHFDLLRMEKAWTALLQKHPILRATFVPVIRSSIRLALCVFDVQHWQLTSRKLSRKVKEIDALREEARVSVEYPPRVPGIHSRLTILEGKEDTFLILNLHHFQYDAGSLPLLFKSLEALYFGHEFECDTDLNRHIGRLSSSPSKLAEQEAYWRSVFPSEWSPTFFPVKPHRKGGPKTNCIVRGTIKNLKVLQDSAKAADLPLHTILLASWAKVHALRCSSSKVTFGLWHHGRSGMGEGLALPCLNFLPLRVANTRLPILDLARELMKDLQRRSGVVENSRLADISKWAGYPQKPLCNVYVNILLQQLLANVVDTERREGTEGRFESLKLPYGIPESISERSNGWKNTFSIPEVQDDCMIEIFLDSADDSIGMAIECESSVLTDIQAHQLAKDFARVVDKIFKRNLRARR